MFKIQYLAENWKPDGTNILMSYSKEEKHKKKCVTYSKCKVHKTMSRQQYNFVFSRISNFRYLSEDLYFFLASIKCIINMVYGVCIECKIIAKAINRLNRIEM